MILRTTISKPAVNLLISVLFLAAPNHLNAFQQYPGEYTSVLNGRIWHNEYSNTVGDQFFPEGTFLKGSVFYNGQEFINLDLKYDIASDELILRIDPYPIIIMNKEMVDSFYLFLNNRSYRVINAGNDTSGILRGYVNVLYDGPSTLYVKYTKKIMPLAVDGKYDLFQQEHRVYLRKDSEILPVPGKRRLLDLLEDRKKEIRHYIKYYRLRILKKNPVMK